VGTERAGYEDEGASIEGYKMAEPKYKGKKLGPFEVEVEEGSTKLYAERTEDLNPLYVDEEYAKKSKFGGIIAQPNYAVVYMLAGVMDAFTDPAMPEIMADLDFEIGLQNLLHGEQELEFFEPVRPGDKISTEAEVVNVYKKKNLGFMEFGTASRNQKGELVSKGIFTAVFTGI